MLTSVGVTVTGGTSTTFTISPTSFVYNGSSQGPTITPSPSNATYSTTGTALATTVGGYSVTANATGSYSGTSGNVSWNITQATPSISYSAPAAITYGTAITATQLNASSGTAGNFTYTLDGNAVTANGSTIPSATGSPHTLVATLTPTDSTDYTTATATVSLTVNPEPTTFTGSPPSFTYSGGAQAPTITPSIGGATYSVSYSGTGSTSYGPSSTAPSAAGTYQVVATANGNYSGSSTIAFTIGKAGLTVTAASPTQTYNGSTLSIGAPATSGLVSGDSLTSYTNSPTSVGPAVGSYTTSVSAAATADGIANYNVTYVAGTATISQEGGVTFTGSPPSFTYSGGAQAPTITPSIGGATYSVSYSGTGSTSYGPSSTAPSAAGTYQVVATANGNYSGSSTIAFTIGKAGLTVTAASPTQTYNGSTLSIGAPATSGLVSGDSLTGYTNSPTSVGPAVGSYTTSVSAAATADGIANYNVTYVAGTATINPESDTNNLTQLKVLLPTP